MLSPGQCSCGVVFECIIFLHADDGMAPLLTCMCRENGPVRRVRMLVNWMLKA